MKIKTNLNVIKLDALEKFNDLVLHDSIIKKRVKRVNKNKIYYYNIRNLTCTCIIRIRETSNYINQMNIIKENICGEAFSFYELVNLISIIFECTNSLFDLFGNDLSLEEILNQNKIFVKSNKTRISDFKFFKFIRSASFAHPNKTNRYGKITKTKYEFYPYALWNVDTHLFVLRDKKIPLDFDVGLISWSNNPNCLNKEYYLYLDEFFNFTNCIIDSIELLLPKIENLINDYKEKRRCKILKPIEKFKTEKEYCLYLRKRLFSKNVNFEFADGGLLIASHIFENDLLDKNFKKYILKRVSMISKEMLVDIEKIGFDDIFEDLNLFELNGCFPSIDLNYIAQKFYDYLKKEAKREIETKEFINYRSALRHEDDNLKYNDAEWAVQLLFRIKSLYREEDLEKATSFADLYEITLQRIWYYLYNNKEDK